MSNLKRANFTSTLLLILLINCSGCAPKTEEATSPISNTTPATQNTVQPSTSTTFGEMSIDDGFTFDMQNLVTLDLNFTTVQHHTQIDIYLEFEPETSTPTLLVEQSELKNNHRYFTKLNIPSYISSVIAVFTGDVNDTIELPIDRHRNITFTYE